MINILNFRIIHQYDIYFYIFDLMNITTNKKKEKAVLNFIIKFRKIKYHIYIPQVPLHEYKIGGVERLISSP